MINKKLIKIEAMKELARREFFFYCNLRSKEFYNENRPFIVNLCNELQAFIEGEDEVLILNLPPR